MDMHETQRFDTNSFAGTMGQAPTASKGSVLAVLIAVIIFLLIAATHQ